MDFKFYQDSVRFILGKSLPGKCEENSPTELITIEHRMTQLATSELRMTQLRKNQLQKTQLITIQLNDSTSEVTQLKVRLNFKYERRTSKNKFESEL
jgi:hypothetical protein